MPKCLGNSNIKLSEFTSVNEDKSCYLCVKNSFTQITVAVKSLSLSVNKLVGIFQVLVTKSTQKVELKCF